MILAQLCDNQDFFPISFRQLAQDTLPRQSAPPPPAAAPKPDARRSSTGSTKKNGSSQQARVSPCIGYVCNVCFA